jgi:hypothetical protein
LEVKARCCVKLGRWRQAREALEGVGLVEGETDKGEYVELGGWILPSVILFLLV